MFWWSQLFAFLIMLVPSLVMTVGLVSSILWAQQNPNVQSMGFDSVTGQEDSASILDDARQHMVMVASTIARVRTT